MDPLSGVLSLLKPHNTMCGGFDVGGDWSLQFPEHEGIKCEWHSDNLTLSWV